MITIFTTAKPFLNKKTAVLQKNAILSWKEICPGAEIIIFGDDEGVADFCNKFKIKNVPEIKKDSFGKPLLDSIFEQAKRYAKNDILAYISSDIILLSDLSKSIEKIKLPLFLMAGRRRDLNMENEINFNENGWRKKLLDAAEKNGKLHGHCATDCMVFPKGFRHNMLPFAIGVAGWDNWLIYRAKFLKIPVIDATPAVDMIHQNHDYSYSSFGKSGGKLGGRIEGPQLKKNLVLAGNSLNVATLMDADWILDDAGNLKKPSFFRYILSKISLFYLWRVLRRFRRQLRHLFSI